MCHASHARARRQELDKRLLHTLTLRERGIRRSAVQREEADDVARLRTPEFGAKEQVVEEVLRQLQGHGPLEQLRESLQAVDRSGAGLVRAEEFRALLTGMDRFTFEDRHVQFLISIAARGAGPVGAPQMVAYPTILEKLNVARNRRLPRRRPALPSGPLSLAPPCVAVPAGLGCVARRAARLTARCIGACRKMAALQRAGGRD